MNDNTRKGLFLFWSFFKGMMFAFTGGMTAIPVVEKDIVYKKKWLTDEEFWRYPTLGQSLPGVIGMHNAILIGNRIAGPFGAFMAALGVIAPAFGGMLVIASLFMTVVDNPYIQGMIRGIRMIAVVIILGNACHLLQTTRKGVLSIVLVIGAILVPLLFGVSAFATIITCGIIGILSIFINPEEQDNMPSVTGDKK